MARLSRQPRRGVREGAGAERALQHLQLFFPRSRRVPARNPGFPGPGVAPAGLVLASLRRTFQLDAPFEARCAMAAQPYDIVVGRSDLADVRVVPAVPPELGNDQIHVAIESYALTANNITYGVAGETMKYWTFYEVADWAQSNGRPAGDRAHSVGLGGRHVGRWDLGRDPGVAQGSYGRARGDQYDHDELYRPQRD